MFELTLNYSENTIKFLFDTTAFRFSFKINKLVKFTLNVQNILEFLN